MPIRRGTPFHPCCRRSVCASLQLRSRSPVLTRSHRVARALVSSCPECFSAKTVLLGAAVILRPTITGSKYPASTNARRASLLRRADHFSQSSLKCGNPFRWPDGTLMPVRVLFSERRRSSSLTAPSWSRSPGPFGFSVIAWIRAESERLAPRGGSGRERRTSARGACVIVKSTGSSMTREVTADDRGEFRIEGLLPGPIASAVTAKGFAEATADVDVAVSLVRDVTVTLKPESGHETVNVQGNASSITTESIDTASAVHQGRSQQPGPGDSSARGAQLRQHRLPRSRNRARRAFRSRPRRALRPSLPAEARA